jgi:hypothetical protein
MEIGFKNRKRWGYPKSPADIYRIRQAFSSLICGKSRIFSKNVCIMGNHQILRIVLCLAILAAYFLPINNSSNLGFGLEISAWDVVAESIRNMGKTGNMPGEFYLLVGCFLVMLIAVIAILLISALRRPLSSVLLFLPVLVIAALLITAFSQSPLSASETVRSFGTGFYIMMVASFLMLFTNISETDAVKA